MGGVLLLVSAFFRRLREASDGRLPRSRSGPDLVRFGLRVRRRVSVRCWGRGEVEGLG